MARHRIYSALLLLILITDVRTQFFNDFFQGFQPIIYQQVSRPTTKHYTNDVTTKRPKITTRKTENRHETTRKPVPVSYSFDEIGRDDNIRQVTKEKQPKRKQTTILANFFTTTVKPLRKTTKNNSSHRNSSTNSNSGVNSRPKPKDTKVNNNNGRLLTENTETQGKWFDKPIISNIADDYYTTRPNYEVTNKPNFNSNYENNPNENYDSSRPYYNTYTTKNPFYNRPGVKPAIIENRPPITNRPVTKRPTFIISSRPTDAGAISFPEEDVSPEIVSGPDEDYMSDVDKKRYIELAERMCDKYKALNMKQLQAIPLVPSPEPVQVNISSCTPTNVPLVVGGKVVSIREFPHMALLGWVKLEGGGYSWKCGGSLVSEQYVLTAAHCAYQERDNTVVSGAPRVVQLGSSFLDDPGALVVKVSAVVRHPKYKASRSYYDTALLKLASPVTFSEVIKPACLGVPPPVGKHIIATGWGQTQAGGEQSQELRSVSLPIWDMQSCARTLGTSRKMPTGPSSDSQMCAGEPRGGKDTCQGDSGGPAQIQEGCTWRVIAVTSVGRSCAARNTPGLYSLVQHAFVAAQVFGGNRNNRNSLQNNNNQRTGNNQARNNQDNDNQSNRNNDNQRRDNTQGNRNNDYNNNNQRSNNNQGNRNNDYGNNNQGNSNNNNNQRYDSNQDTRNNAYDSNNQRTNNNQGNNDNQRYDNNQGTRYQRTDYANTQEYSNQENQRSDSTQTNNNKNYRIDYGYENQENNYGTNSRRQTNRNDNYRAENYDTSNNNRPQNEYSNNNEQQSAYSNDNQKYIDYSNNQQRTAYGQDYSRKDGNSRGYYDSARIWW